MGACGCDARGGDRGQPGEGQGPRPGLVGGQPGGLRAASAVGRPGRAASLHARAGGGGGYLLRCEQAHARDGRRRREARGAGRLAQAAVMDGRL